MAVRRTASQRRPMAIARGSALGAIARASALVGALLVLAIVLMANRLARTHLRLRLDLSQDRLWSVSAPMRALLARLEDTLHVKAYFTGDITNGEVALAKARLEGMLSEYEGLARGRMRVDTLDPDTSGESLLEAGRYGITPFETLTMDGVRAMRQVVHLGLVLRYRGREQSIPLAIPASFESAFAQRMVDLLRDRRRVVAWYGPHPEPGSPDAPWGSFEEARARIARRHELRDLPRLEIGLGVPRDVDLLLVVRPETLHPRSAFEIDQFAQRGGRLLLAVDQTLVAPSRLDVRRVPSTGLEGLLERWGARVAQQHVWDEQCAAARLTRAIEVEGRSLPQQVETPYQLFPRLDGASFDAQLPAVAGLQQGALYWAQPIAPPGAERATGAERIELVRSSPNSWRVDMIESIDFDEERRSSLQRNLWAAGSGQRHALAVALVGRLPSAFEGSAPAPFDPLTSAPQDARATTDEPVLSRAAETQVVVIGDCDWMRDGYLSGNERLFDNLVDWLVMDEDLLALRARTPRDRPLRDFLGEELRRRGLDALPADESLAELDQRVRSEGAARSAAAHRRWRVMLLPVASSLALVLGAGLAWNLWGGRYRRRSGA